MIYRQALTVQSINGLYLFLPFFKMFWTFSDLSSPPSPVRTKSERGLLVSPPTTSGMERLWRLFRREQFGKWLRINGAEYSVILVKRHFKMQGHHKIENQRGKNPRTSVDTTGALEGEILHQHKTLLEEQFCLRKVHDWIVAIKSLQVGRVQPSSSWPAAINQSISFYLFTHLSNLDCVFLTLRHFTFTNNNSKRKTTNTFFSTRSNPECFPQSENPTRTDIYCSAFL